MPNRRATGEFHYNADNMVCVYSAEEEAYVITPTTEAGRQILQGDLVLHASLSTRNKFRVIETVFALDHITPLIEDNEDVQTKT